MDSKGCKIHASIRRTLVYRFQNQISEGRVYQISSFGVCENGDVIGILTGEQEVEKHVHVQAAFFGKYVDEIVGQLASGDMTKVVVVQFAKIKPSKGKPSIQNFYGVTKILFNPAIDGPSAQVLTQLHDSNRRFSKKSVCVVLSTVNFIPDDNSWYYPACKCNKKVYPAEDMYFCEACVLHVVTAILKYKIHLRVMDANDSTPFVVFYQEANNLLNKPCADLVEKCHKDPNDYQVSSEILNSIEKTFLFKVDVDNSSNTWFEPSYKVKRICSDREVISQFKIANPQLEGSPPYMLLTTPSSGGMVEGSSSSFAKDLNDEFNVAGDPHGLTSPNSSVVDLSKDSQEGFISLDKDVGFDGDIKAALTINGNSQDPRHVENNDSPPFKRHTLLMRKSLQMLLTARSH
ncbi:uncharacterized protein LOC130730901 [Lotus japonicus]|uniref:uncharacterized protein LOC130730901 n=1 Tax=Lotus japonicus TaxID=34305 RepID=UPI0025872334|nr:uncharacterized protein LOC130730901 [Lotus japonicus]